MTILTCPFCKAPITKDGGSYYCSGERRHCFNIGKSGYVTLTGALGSSGDDRDMVRARTAFLDSGSYLPFADAVCALLPDEGVIVDAGCGEGYYTNFIAEKHRSASVYGFDLSKYACDKGAKRAAAGGLSTFFGVAGIFNLPIRDKSVDAVVSLFAPVSDEEFSRVLKDGGVLLIGAAGQKHLIELKQAVYAKAYENSGRRDLPESFKLLKKENLKYKFVCPNENLKNLFMMTPYAFKTSKEDIAKLDIIDSLEITADFEIYLYRKS